MSVVLAALAVAIGPAIASAPVIASADVGGGLGVAVERTGSGAYEVDWNTGKVVDIYVAEKAGAPASARRQLVDDDDDGKAAVSVTGSSRPFFYVVPADGKGEWVAERLLPLEGGRNFRDLGGYRAADGRTVAWGKLYRSGSMVGLTPADVEYLGRLGIRTVCDFRTSKERADEPNKWAQTAGIDYWTRDYEMSGGDLARLFRGGADAAQARAAMISLYRELPYEQAEAYKTMFRKMLDGQVPLAFNCSAGKDRTGLAAALILMALGVPRDAVMADYQLTDRYLPAAMARDKAAASQMLAAIPRDVLGAVMVADPAYLNAAFDEMTSRNGSPERYLRTVTGLTDADIARLRDMFLE